MRTPMRFSKAVALLLGFAVTTFSVAAVAASGERAPGFELRAQDGRLVSLAEFRGKRDVVLFFQEGPG